MSKNAGNIGVEATRKKGRLPSCDRATLEPGFQDTRGCWCRGIDLTSRHGWADKTREIESYVPLLGGCCQAGKGGLCAVSR